MFDCGIERGNGLQMGWWYQQAIFLDTGVHDAVVDWSLLRELDQDHDSGVILVLEMGEWEPMAGES